MGLNQGRSFSASWGSLTECLGYLAQVFDFLTHRFDGPELVRQQQGTRASRPAELAPARAA